MKLKSFLLAFPLLGAMLITNTSCDKKTDCMATVICKDANGMLLRGATIQLLAYVKTPLKGTITADVRANGVTDENGKVTFTFKLPAIFDIKASKGNLTGTGIIKLEEGNGVEKAVTIQ